MSEGIAPPSFARKDLIVMLQVGKDPAGWLDSMGGNGSFFGHGKVIKKLAEEYKIF